MAGTLALPRRALAKRIASRSASIMLPGLAWFLPAISKAVPWSGLVRIAPRPSVTFTARSNACILIGINAWSWYIATKPSYWLDIAGTNAVSGGSGPTTCRAGVTGQRQRRLDNPVLLVAQQPPFAGVRIQTQYADSRLFDSVPLAQGLIEQVDGLMHQADREVVTQVEQRRMVARQGKPATDR